MSGGMEDLAQCFTRDIACTMVTLTDAGEACYFMRDEWKLLDKSEQQIVQAFANARRVTLRIE